MKIKVHLKSIRIAIICLSFTIFITMITYSNLTRPRILVIQAYNTDYAWTRDLDIGLKNVFSDYKQYQIMWHYMDTKNHPEEGFVKKAGMIARNLVDSIQPTILITVNNDAQNYVGRFYVDHPHIKLIFTGVNGQMETYGYDRAKNITGLLQRVPLEGLRDIILELTKARKMQPPVRIIHISDESGVVHDDDTYFHTPKPAWWYPIEVRPSRLVSTFDDWKEAILKAQKEVDYVIVSNYRRIYRRANSQEKVSPSDIMKWTLQNTHIPIIGLNAFVTEDGAGLSVAASPIEQGEIAARKAIELLTTNKLIHDIPIEATTHYLVCIRKNVLDKEFQLPLVYENFARYAKEYWD